MLQHLRSEGIFMGYVRCAYVDFDVGHVYCKKHMHNLKAMDDRCYWDFHRMYCTHCKDYK